VVSLITYLALIALILARLRRQQGRMDKTQADQAL
jgi:hypothetical protein